MKNSLFDTKNQGFQDSEMGAENQSLREFTFLEKLSAIEGAKCIYNINYCNAGVGFCFYLPEKDPREFRDNFIGDINIPEDIGWHKALSTDKYYKTFELAVDAEFERLAPQVPNKEDKSLTAL